MNIKTRESSWIKPDGFIASEDEVKKIRKSKKKASSSLSATTECRGSKRPLETVTPDNTEFLAEDYLQVFSKKRQMLYYYNLKNKASQWKRPACLQAAETLQAIENTKSKEEVPCNGAISQSEHHNGAEDKFTLNAEASCFELLSKLNVNATPFIPSFQIERRLAPAVPVHKTCLNNDQQRKVVVKRRISEPSEPEKPKARVSAKERLSLQEGRSDQPWTGHDNRGDQLRTGHDNRNGQPRIGHNNRTDSPRIGHNNRTDQPRTVFDRLGARCHNDECLFEVADSNVALLGHDLPKIPYLPPSPEVEVARYTEVSELRELFHRLCTEDIGIDEPTEALNRWLLDRQLSCIEKTDPVLSCSEKRSVSLYREIMQDLPVKYRLPRSAFTCTSTFSKYVSKFRDIAADCEEEDKVRIEEQCEETQTLNIPYSDTRELMRGLRSSCESELVRYYNDRVEQVCETMNKRCQEGALRVADLAKEEYSSVLPLIPPRTPTTGLVACRPAMPQISDEHISRGDVVSTSTTDKQCKVTYKDSTMSLNIVHYKKLKKLYETTALGATDDKNLLNSRVWCLLKRYKMLRSTMGSGKMGLQENFGLHAALPRKVFELLHRTFHVTFECFASPFNCYFRQYCSAFPDTDCYFGSRGSFFDLNPKSGSFQANPPFSEEIMLAMANHMISLLDESLGALMFVIFIPDWKEPVTPAIPALHNTTYCTHNILLESGNHQYISGNQHIQSLTHYNAVHGTQVFVLQNEAACEEWPLIDDDMDLLREAMSTNY